MAVKVQISGVCMWRILGIAVLALMLAVSQARPLTVQALPDQDGDGVSDAKEIELASMYLPYLQFKAGERFFPVAITYQLANSILKQRYGETVTIVDTFPTVTEISSKDAHFFLANKFGSVEAIAADYRGKRGSLGYTVYARVTKESSTIVVQYWFFYAYNDAPLNVHEGDWEMIEILLDSGETPVSAVYSQHLSGQRAMWADVEKVNATHPTVYVARGSHANYFRPYQGKLGLENDDVGADGFTLQLSSDLGFNLVLLGEIGAGKHSTDQDWLEFGGRWGNWEKLADATAGFAGPYGPGRGDNYDKWHTATSWGQSVRLADGTWFTLSWVASNFLLIFLGITVVLVVWKVWGIARLKKKGGLRLPSVLRTKASAGIVLGIIGIALSIGGMLLPWYAVRANIQSSLVSTQGETDLLVMDGQRGVLVNMLVGGNGPTPAFSLQIPLGIILLVGIVLGFLDIIGLKTAKSLGNKYLMGGITFLIVFAVLILVIVQLTSAIQSLVSMMGVSLPSDAIEMANAVAQQPLQGTQVKTFGDFGSVSLSWGLGLGAYMFLAAALTKIAGGIVLRASEKKQAEVLQPLPPPPPL